METPGLNPQNTQETKELAWYQKLEIALSNREQLTPVLNSFTQEEWSEFINGIAEDELPFYVDRGRDQDSMFVILSSSLRKVNPESKEKIGISLTKILQLWLKDDITEQDSEMIKVAFLIAWGVQIEIKDKEFLKKVITESSESTTKFKAARLLIA